MAVMSRLTSGNSPFARPAFMLIGLGLCWASRLLAIKLVADRGGKVMDTVVVVTAILVVILSVTNQARSKPLPRGPEHLKFYVLAGLLGFGAPLLAELMVAAHLPALLFVMIVATAPIWTLLLSAFMRVETLNIKNTLGTLIGFGAVVTVVYATQAEHADQMPFDLPWVIAAFTIPILYALYMLHIANRWPEGLDNLQGAQGQAIAALIVFSGIWLGTSGQLSDLLALSMQWPIWVVVSLEILGLVLLFQIARLRGGSYVARANYIAVVAGAVLSIVLFGQDFRWAVVLGTGLLVAALWLTKAKDHTSGLMD